MIVEGKFFDYANKTSIFIQRSGPIKALISKIVIHYGYLRKFKFFSVKNRFWWFFSKFKPSLHPLMVRILKRKIKLQYQNILILRDQEKGTIMTVAMLVGKVEILFVVINVHQVFTLDASEYFIKNYFHAISYNSFWINWNIFNYLVLIAVFYFINFLCYILSIWNRI